MTKMQKEKRIKEVQKTLLENCNVVLNESDVYVADSFIYISTQKVAELFRTSSHNFSNEYVKPLKDCGVERVILGRHKFYRLLKIMNILKEVVYQDKSVLQVCSMIKKEKRKREKRKKRKAR